MWKENIISFIKKYWEFFVGLFISFITIFAFIPNHRRKNALKEYKDGQKEYKEKKKIWDRQKKQTEKEIKKIDKLIDNSEKKVSDLDKDLSDITSDDITAEEAYKKLKDKID